MLAIAPLRRVERAALRPFFSFFLMWRFLAPLASGAEGAPVVVYDLSSDFSTNINPAGPWSYGWKSTLAGSFTAFPLNGAGPAENGVPISFWYKPVSPPAVYVNPSSTTATSDNGQGSFPPGTVWFYPGIENNPDNFGTIRFTVPSALGGNYQIESHVQSYLDGPGAGDTDFHIVHNGVEVFGHFVAARSATGFTNVLVLAAGDTIDFAIGRGLDNRVHGSGLKIQATLTYLSTEPIPPIILAHPQDQTAYVGTNVTLAVSAVGTPPLWYQWLYNSNSLPDATNRSLVLTNVQGPEAGFYSVIVSNIHGAVTSLVAQLTITVPPPAEVIRGPYLQGATTSNLIVRWRTDRPTDSRVFYGASADQLLSEASDATVTDEHSVLISGLLPDSRYYYAIGTGTNLLAGPGPTYYFTTLSAAPKPTRIWVLGDCGTGHFSTAPFEVQDAYKQWNGARHTDVWLMLGDNAYDAGTDAEYQGAVFNVFTEFLRHNVLWSTIGNHETYSPKPGGGYAYFDIFSLPTDGRSGGLASGTENYYSFNFGSVHFVCLDSELSDKRPGSAMLEWLDQDLAANTNEWVIVFWHSPPYTKGSHDSDYVFDSAGYLIQMRENVLPILDSYGVDLVLGGHSHSYERSYLLNGHYGFSPSLQPSMIKDNRSGRIDETGPYWKNPEATAAGSGAVYVVAGSSGRISGGTLNHPVMFSSLNQLGSLVIDIDGPRLDARFLRENGDIDDYFSIVKGEPLRVATYEYAEGLLHVTFKTLRGRTYRLQKATSLEAPNWSDISPDILANGATTQWSGPVDAGADRYFFRAVQLD